MMYKEAAFLILSVFSITFVVAPDPDPCDPKIRAEPLTSVNWYKPGESTNKVSDPKKEAASAAQSYAYCAAALIESRAAEKTKDPKGVVTRYSAQQILDSLDHDSTKNNIQSALEFCRNGLIKSEAVYNYGDHKGAASLSGEKLDYYCCEYFGRNEIKRRVSYAPVCVELTVPEDFLKLTTGIYQCPKLKPTDKSIKITVLLHGYDEKYWFIKAYLGQNWGSGGFAKLENAADCGIRNVVSYGVLGVSKKFTKQPTCVIQ